MTPKQRRALPLLAVGISAIEVGKQVSINPSTISHWMNHDPEFMEELNILRCETMGDSILQMKALVTPAADEIAKIMTSSEDQGLRLKAAMFVISNVSKI